MYLCLPIAIVATWATSDYFFGTCGGGNDTRLKLNTTSIDGDVTIGIRTSAIPLAVDSNTDILSLIVGCSILSRDSLLANKFPSGMMFHVDLENTIEGSNGIYSKKTALILRKGSGELKLFPTQVLIKSKRITWLVYRPESSEKVFSFLRKKGKLSIEVNGIAYKPKDKWQRLIDELTVSILRRATANGYVLPGYSS